MAIAPEVAEILNEPIATTKAVFDLLRGMNIPDFETPGDAIAALQNMLMPYVVALNKAVVVLADEVDRLGGQLE